MTDAELSRALAESLDALADGRATPAECLARYPQHRAELAALLNLAAELRAAALPVPSPAFRARLRARLSDRAARPATPGERLRALRLRATLAAGAWLQPARGLAAAATLVLVLLFAGPLAGAAGAARPGDMLFPLKAGVEWLRLEFASGATTGAGLHLEFAEQRLAEAQALAGEDRADDLAEALAGYRAHVEAAQALLAGLPPGGERLAVARLLDQRLAGHPAALAILAGQAPRGLRPAVDDALALATSARAFAQGLLETSPRPTPTATRPAEPTHEPSATHQPSATHAPRQTATPHPSATRGGTHTPAATHPPTATPQRATHTPVPSVQPSATHQPTAEPTHEPTHEPTRPGPTPPHTPTPEPHTATPVPPTATPVPPTATHEPAPTHTPWPSATSTPRPTATPQTPQPSRTPLPSATPRPPTETHTPWPNATWTPPPTMTPRMTPTGTHMPTMTPHMTMTRRP